MVDINLSESNKIETVTSFLQVSVVGAYIVNQVHNIVYINPELESHFGPSNGRKCYDYLHGRNSPCAECKNQEVFLDGKTVIWKRHNSKINRDYELIDIPLKDRYGTLNKLEIFVDTTEQNRAKERLSRYQSRLKRLSSQILLAQEEERRRISTELHDVLGAELCLANLQLSALIESESRNQTAVQLCEIRNTVKRLISQARSLTFELSPPLLYLGGLSAALRQLVEHYGKNHGLIYDYFDDGIEKPLSANTAIMLHRSARELVVNSIRHSGSRTLKYNLLGKQTGFYCWLKIADQALT